MARESKETKETTAKEKSSAVKKRTSTASAKTKATARAKKESDIVAEQAKPPVNQAERVMEIAAVMVPLLNIRKEPSLISEIIRVAKEEEELQIVGHTLGFAEIAENGGYAHLDYLTTRSLDKTDYTAESCQGGEDCEKDANQGLCDKPFT